MPMYAAAKFAQWFVLGKKLMKNLKNNKIMQISSCSTVSKRCNY